MNLEIANRLQKLRKEKGYSQEQLAEELGISRQAVSKWERAESSPDTDNLICLAKLYGVSLDELLSTDESVEEIVGNKEIEDEEAKRIAEEIRKEGNRKNKIVEGLSTLCLMLIVIAFFVIGFVWGLWHPAWIIFLFVPISHTLIEAIVYKNPHEFAYPVLLAAIYLFIGSVWDLWHPGWVIFITIPAYYGVLDCFVKDPDDIDEDDEEDEDDE